MKRLAIVYGENISEIEKTALGELSRILLDYTLEYPICKSCNSPDLSSYKCIYIGTKKSNSYIEKNSHAPLSHEEEYRICAESEQIIIEGFDGAGVLYGVLDFYNKYMLKFEYTDNDKYWENFLLNESFPEFEFTSYPSVKERGLWTWSHVIYDILGYLDNMMRLKMNSVIIWCDHLPINAKEIVNHAHRRNIKVIWGYPWLWDTDCKKFDLTSLDGYPEKIFERYEREFRDAGGDGIYFQTFTELHDDNIDGVAIADAAAKFVNKTVSLFYNKYPDIRLQFGLHATSVKDRLTAIATVDPRVQIIWEDAGAFPFSYMPGDISTFAETQDFAIKVARLRGNDDYFGAVTKGLVKLDWLSFLHPEGAHYMTGASKELRENRLIRKRKIWKYVQAHWLANYGKALEMVKLLCETKGGALSVYALVEDGLFEEEIFFPVALYSEMLWNTERDPKDIITEVAMRKYVTFA